MQEKPDFKRSFLTLMDESAAGDHPGAEVLAAYRTGDLPETQRERVRRHLTGCGECAALARDLDLFTEPARLSEEGDEVEAAAFLSSLQPSLAPKTSEPRASWRLPLAVAASLALAVPASWWLSRGIAQRAMLGELSRPRANVSTLDLVEDRSERTGSPASVAEMVADIGAVLILTPDRPGEFPSYEAKILDSGGGLVATVENLEKDSYDETFTLLIPPESLDLGDYRVELHGFAGSNAELIASYLFRVTPLQEAPS